MTSAGLSGLATGFTGDQSRVIRTRFFNAFDELAERLAKAERTITEQLYKQKPRRRAPHVGCTEIINPIRHAA